MATKKDQTNTNKQTKGETTSPIAQELIDNAIAAGQSVLSEGKPKIEAAMAIYRMLETADQQTVVGALINGANLTPMGAVTYWYNCRRRLNKERKTNPQ